MSGNASWRWPLLLSGLAGAGALLLWSDPPAGSVAQPTRLATAGVAIANRADATTSTSTSTSTSARAPTTSTTSAAASQMASAPPQAPGLAAVLRRSAQPAPAGNPFAVITDPRPSQAGAVVAAAPLPPPAPETPPYVYQGKQQQGGRWQVFLVRDEQVHIVQVGNILDRRWRVDVIQPPVLTFTDLDHSQRFSIPIGELP